MHTGVVSKHPAAVNVLTGSPHCRTLQKRTFILHFPQFCLDRAGRRLFSQISIFGRSLDQVYADTRCYRHNTWNLL